MFLLLRFFSGLCDFRHKDRRDADANADGSPRSIDDGGGSDDLESEEEQKVLFAISEAAKRNSFRELDTIAFDLSR